MKKINLTYNDKGYISNTYDDGEFYIAQQEDKAVIISATFPGNLVGSVNAYVKSGRGGDVIENCGAIDINKHTVELALDSKYLAYNYLKVGFEVKTSTKEIRFEPLTLEVDEFVNVTGSSSPSPYTVSVKVGKVTQLEPDEEPSITNTGTEKHLVLNFGIPKGKKGETGPKGDPGYTPKKGVDYFTPEEVASFGIDKINGQMAIVQNDIENIYESTPNLFNKNDERIVKGYYLSSNPVAGSKYSYSHPLPVIEGVRYKFTTNNAVGVNNKRIVYCNERGEYELHETYGTFTDTQFADEMAEDYSYVAFTANKTGLVLVNVGTMSYDEFMFCELDRFPNEYVEFARYSKLLTPMENLIGEPSDDLVRKLANALGTSPLNGKKASFNGDSICAGAGYSGGYGKIITDLFGMTYQNVGVGGGTIVTGQTTEAGKARHSVCGTIVNMDSDADYIIVEGGVNDASLEVSLGAISTGYNATFDTTTFYGAFESMCKELVTRFAGKKVGYIAVHKMTPQFSSTDTTYGYYQAAKKCCEKWGIPFCDLNTEVPPLKYITSLKEAYTHNGDGWHPNKAGYDAYYVPKIIAFMERL